MACNPKYSFKEYDEIILKVSAAIQKFENIKLKYSVKSSLGIDECNKQALEFITIIDKQTKTKEELNDTHIPYYSTDHSGRFQDPIQ
jgi:hypothetical protein